MTIKTETADFEFVHHGIKLKAFIYHDEFRYCITIHLGNEFVGSLGAEVDMRNPNFFWVKTWSDDNELINVEGLVKYLIKKEYLIVIAEFETNGNLVYLTQPNFPIKLKERKE